MYYSDKPIEKISEDKLDRKGFAKTIATTLFDLKQADTFTVGLLGKWGVGKTSLVNLILSEFKAIDERNNTNTIILKFEPWHFTDTTQLISQFLIQLAYKFNDKKKEKINEIGEALTKYSVAFELAEGLPIPYVNTVGKFGKFAMNLIGKKLQKNKIDSKNILKQKEYVVDLLEKEKPIDYLSNEQVLRSINNLRENKMLFSLDEDYQYRAGAFYIAMANKTGIKEHIPQKRVLHLLSEWRN